ncbi:type III secretion system chaperone [Photobacterium sp. J15]|uniref:type III secretion system chaperone n=1 Tax=Photobacterium sp. J15 TaxID=265901 RepID=UPI0007E3ABAE|nr:type III secretion system chaperone [Photobacterium sp. J15]
MNKEAWQQALSDVTGVMLEFDENDAASLQLQVYSLVTNFYYRRSEVVLYSEVGWIGETPPMELLKANCMWQQTNGATLSVFEENRVLLAVTLNEAMAPHWQAMYDRFVQAAAYWAEQLSGSESDDGISTDNELTVAQLAGAFFV